MTTGFFSAVSDLLRPRWRSAQKEQKTYPALSATQIYGSAMQTTWFTALFRVEKANFRDHLTQTIDTKSTEISHTVYHEAIAGCIAYVLREGGNDPQSAYKVADIMIDNMSLIIESSSDGALEIAAEEIMKIKPTDEERTKYYTMVANNLTEKALKIAAGQNTATI